MIFRAIGKAFQAPDGATVFELITPRTCGVKGMSVASGYLEPRCTARRHFHREIEEVYIIIDGHGRLYIDDEVHCIAPGDTAFIAPGRTHALENISHFNRLEVVAVCSPPYSDDDTFFIE